MCGITGFCDFSKTADREVLVSMTDSLTHRGPDDSGYELFETAQATIGLGHRRLSIIDLSAAGHQPMLDGHYAIVFNGEVYNFQEIKETLESLGHTFHSTSDTEVILKGFQQWGTAVVDRLIGMFAFSIYDKAQGKLWIFRDRAGVKPLYYQWTPNGLIFSSELKAQHHHPGFIDEIDHNSLALFLQYSYIPAPHCIFKSNYKLKPGHYLEIDIDHRTLREVKYWDAFDYYNQPKHNISEEEALHETEQLMKSAYAYRMVADVPVGVFLSGGYDSTSVAALLQTGRTEKLKTFTIGFHENSFNEANEAKKIAEYLGTDHTEYYVTPKEAAEVIPKLPVIYDEPFADNSTVPTTLVSMLARKSVKVALSADGGDEIFGGYNKFNQSVKYTQQVPIWFQSLMSKSMGLIDPDHIPYFRMKYNFATRYEKMQKIWAEHSAVVAMKLISQYITENEVKKYLANDFAAYDTNFDQGAVLNGHCDSINKMLAIDYKTFLVDNNLVKVDRATMSVGLEGREPMLDHRLLEYLAQLPSGLKIKNGVNKYLLKAIVHKYVPKELMERPKMPFIAPLTVWFKTELKAMMEDYLSEERLNEQGIFNTTEIIKLRDKYFSGGKISHQKLWKYTGVSKCGMKNGKNNYRTET